MAWDRALNIRIVAIGNLRAVAKLAQPPVLGVVDVDGAAVDVAQRERNGVAGVVDLWVERANLARQRKVRHGADVASLADDRRVSPIALAPSVIKDLNRR